MTAELRERVRAALIAAKPGDEVDAVMALLEERVLWRGEVWRHDPFGFFDGGPGESGGVPEITGLDVPAGTKVKLVIDEDTQ